MMYRRTHPDAVIDVEIPSDWVDVSSPNDSAPCWRVGRDVLVWVHSADPATREAGCEDSPRFSVSIEGEVGSVIDTNSWHEAICTARITSIDRKLEVLRAQLRDHGYTDEQIAEILRKRV